MLTALTAHPAERAKRRRVRVLAALPLAFYLGTIGNTVRRFNHGAGYVFLAIPSISSALPNQENGEKRLLLPGVFYSAPSINFVDGKSQLRT